MRFSPRHTLVAVATAAVAVTLLGVPAAADRPESSPAPEKKADFRLTLLHNNDGESKLATGSSVAGYGGAARFATVVDRLRADAVETFPGGDNRTKPRSSGTLLVSSGDNFLAGLALLLGFEEGPPWPDAVVANALGYDAMTIGNHEFDFGQARLAEFIDGVDDDIPFISANLGFEGTLLEDLADAGRIAPSVVVERDGEQIGVIGLTTPDIAGISSPGNVQINSDLAAVVNAQVADLEGRGVDKIVVSAHLQGLAADEALIPLVGGVDVWIAGGGDDLLANPDDVLIPGETAVGTYPKVVSDAGGRDVLVVSTAGEYKYVGRLTVDFDKQGEITTYNDAKSGPVRVSGTPGDPDFAPEDPFLKENAVDPVTAFAAGLASQPNGSSEIALVRGPGNDPIRRRETGYGSVVADSFLWKARQLASGNPQIDEPNVGLTNGGGIRQDIDAGPINKAETFAALPFFNQIAVVEDVGCEPLRQILERAYSGLPGIAGQFAHLAGMRVVVDPARQVQVLNTATLPATIVTPGERVRDLWLTNGTLQDTADDTPLIVNGAAVANCPTVDLATTDFSARDGDFYPFRSQGLTFEPVGALYNQAFEDYILAPQSEGGLGGTITAAQYPAAPPAGAVRRITIAGD